MKSLHVYSLKVPFFSLLLLSTSFWISDSYGMEPDEGDRPLQNRAIPSKTLHIVSPEAVQIQNELKDFEKRHPNVTGGRIYIQNQADFKDAMEYLILKEKEASIFKACIIGSMSNPLTIKLSLSAEANLNSYIKHLLDKVSSSFRTKEDQVTLRHALGKNYVRFGFAKLEEFALAMKTSPPSQVQLLLTQIFQIRQLLATAPDLPYSEEFEQNLRLRLSVIFSGQSLNNPLMNSIPDLRRIIDEGQKELQEVVRSSHYLKLDEFKQSYDLYFQGKSFQIAEQFNEILKAPPSNAFELLQKNMREYSELEREGLRFKLKLEGNTTPELNEETLTEFYIFMTKRLRHLPNKDPVEILPHLILSFITADQKGEALKRLTVLERLLLNKGNLSENFLHFKAKVKAMCSDFKELNQLISNEDSSKLTEQQLRKREKNRLKKQRQKKRKQEEKLALQSTTFPILEVKEEIVQVIKELVDSPLLITKEAEDIKSSLPVVPEIAQEKEKKLKRHLEAEAQRQKEKNQSINPVKAEDKSPAKPMSSQSVSSSMEKRHLNIEFSFGSKSFKILNQLFSNDWKVSRKDIETFFKEIGQEVNKKTGSSHHIIKISNGIVIKKEGQTIGMISDLSSNMEGHISLPSWSEMVPLYIQREVMKLIDLMGITKDNYKKGQDINYRPH